ncbi:MAG: hypothetical protein ACRDK1_01150 [Solirubrobacterales bacterium]
MVLTAVGFLVWSAPASAMIDAQDLRDAKVRTATFVPPGEDDVGGSVTCPSGTGVLTGGAYWHEPGEAPSITADFEELNSSGPRGGDHWYADGRGTTRRRLTVAVRCVADRKLRDVSTEKLSLDPADGGPVGGTVACPSGTRALSGGAVWHPRGAPPDPSLSSHGMLASSAVTSDDRGWYADGTDNYIGDDEIFTISVRCLKVSKLAETKLRARPISAVEHDEIAGAAVKCRHGSRALTGGGLWHPPGGGPDKAGNTGIFSGANSFVKHGRAWFTDGLNFVSPDPTRDLTVEALCLKPG